MKALILLALLMLYGIALLVSTIKQRRAREIIPALLNKNHPTPGNVIREKLGYAGVRMSGPTFYSLMSDLEKEGLVRRELSAKPLGGHMIQSQHFVLV